jgi:hypothetical protein
MPNIYFVPINSTPRYYVTDYKNELRHNLLGNVEWHDKTLELWIEIFESQT